MYHSLSILSILYPYHVEETREIYFEINIKVFISCFILPQKCGILEKMIDLEEEYEK